MVFKRDNELVLKQLADAFNNHIDNCSYLDVLRLRSNDSVVIEICKNKTISARHSYPSTVIQIIERNKYYFWKYFNELRDSMKLNELDFDTKVVACETKGEEKNIVTCSTPKHHNDADTSPIHFFDLNLSKIFHISPIKESYQECISNSGEIGSTAVIPEISPNTLVSNDRTTNAADNVESSGENYFYSPNPSIYYGINRPASFKHLLLEENEPNNTAEQKRNIPDHEISILDDSSSIINVTTEDFQIPNKLFNLSTNVEKSLKPKRTKNISPSKLLLTANYENCTVLEGKFDIPEDMWNIIFSNKNGKLNGNHYPHYFRNRIAKYVNNTCQIVFKYVKYLKKTDSIKIYGKCVHKCCKKFKIVIIERVAQIYSSNINFCHRKKITTCVKGVERSIMRKKLYATKPSQFKRRSMINAKSSICKIGNLQEIKSDDTYRKIRSEAMSILDRDKHTIIDLILMQRDHGEYIKEVCVPFNVKMFSLEQMKLLERQKMYSNFLPLIYFDATGGLIEPPFENDKKRIYLYSAVVQIRKTKRVCNIFDMISCEHFAKSIFKIINDFRCFLEENNKWPLFGGVVTDFSFANIHAISRACNRQTLIEYLTTCMTICKGEQMKPTSFITIHLCCAHFMKMVSKDIDHLGTNELQNKLFKDLIASCILMDALGEINIFFVNLVVLLKSPFYNDMVKKSHENLLRNCSNKNITDFVNSVSASSTNTDIPVDEDDSKKFGLFRNSPFYVHFFKIMSNIQISYVSTVANPYLNEKFLTIVLNKYLPYCPLWSGIILKYSSDMPRVSNAPIENFFGYVKNQMLEGERNLKCSRVIRKLRENVLAIFKESNMDIEKSRLTKDIDKLNENNSQESWSRKRKRPNTHFLGRFMKKQIEDKFDNLNNQQQVAPLQNNSQSEKNKKCYDLLKCNYCGKGPFLDITTDWVQCDRCDEYVHQSCASNQKQSFSGDFICKLCETVPEIYNSKDENTLNNICKEYLRHLRETVDRDRIEMSTRGQSKSPLWFSERKNRLTASNFGRACKCRTFLSKCNLASDLLSDRIIKTKAMKHGLDNEDHAAMEYAKITKSLCKTVGLILHQDYPFLGASPDRLIDDDGVLEIKCPFNVKDLHPDNVTLDYLDRDGNLKRTHNYYYQIQGLLEITDRQWCDFVIYTFKGISIKRIERDTRFWKMMEAKLKDFYLFHLLPKIVLPNIKYNDMQCKWTTSQDIELLENCLVNDIFYYRELPHGYTVGVYSTIDLYNHEILIADYLSLKGTSWLTNFVVEICLCLLDSKNQYQIVPEYISSAIFNDNLNYDIILMESFSFLKNDLIMPLLVGGNHFCMVIIYRNKKEFHFIDPFESTYVKTKQYLNIFQRFIKYYNQQTSQKLEDDFNIIVDNHVKQTDGYNCGPYIIYFFERILKKQNLTNAYSMDDYRIDLQKLLLQKSDDMNDICLYCGRKALVENCYRCNFCLRYIHKRCLTLRAPSHLVNNMCELCRQY